MKQLILFISISFFIINCCYAQNIKLGKYNIDGLNLYVKISHLDYITISDKDVPNKRNKFSQGAMIKDKEEIRNYFFTVIGDKIYNESMFIVRLFPDIDGPVVNRVINVEVKINKNTEITLAEFKKVFDLIKKNVMLKLPLNVESHNLHDAAQTVTPKAIPKIKQAPRYN